MGYLQLASVNRGARCIHNAVDHRENTGDLDRCDSGHRTDFGRKPCDCRRIRCGQCRDVTQSHEFAAPRHARIHIGISDTTKVNVHSALLNAPTERGHMGQCSPEALIAVRYLQNDQLHLLSRETSNEAGPPEIVRWHIESVDQPVNHRLGHGRSREGVSWLCWTCHRHPGRSTLELRDLHCRNGFSSERLRQCFCSIT